MLPVERDWILSRIHPVLSEIKTVLDIGSESPDYRTKKQKYISELYKALEVNHCKIKTLDMDPDSHADIVCNISRVTNFKLGFDLVLANNILEHICASDFDKAIENIKQAVSLNKYLLVTVPYKLALHNVPIDNGFRPNLLDLWNLFKDSFTFVSGEIWVDKHYREPYISNPGLAPSPEVTGIFLKKTSVGRQNLDTLV